VYNREGCGMLSRLAIVICSGTFPERITCRILLRHFRTEYYTLGLEKDGIQFLLSLVAGSDLTDTVRRTALEPVRRLSAGCPLTVRGRGTDEPVRWF
jgi:hypothetical protein